MEYTFQYIEATRKAFTNVLDQVTLEQLNKVPQGFLNNIIWNYGHIVVSGLRLAYHTPEVKPDLDIPFFSSYCKGTKPGSPVSVEEINQLKDLAFTSIGQIRKDIENKVFASVTPFTTATYGVPVRNIEEIMTTIAMHDNYHYGYALAIRKAVQ